MKIMCKMCNGKGIVGNMNQEDECPNCYGSCYVDRNIKPVKLVEMTLLEFSGFMSKELDNIYNTEHYSECCVLVHMRRGESFVVKYKDAKDVVGYYVRELFPLIDNKQEDK